jgi:hypothetical protein
VSIIDGANSVPYTYTMDAQRFYRTDPFNDSTASIYYNQVSLKRLNIVMGNGGNYFLINGSPILSGGPNSGANFHTGLGADSVRIRGSNSPLDINLGFGGDQSIFIGDAATSLDGIRGVVNVFGSSTNVFVSNEASTRPQIFTISASPGGFGQSVTRQQLNGDHYDTLNTFNFGYLGQQSFSYHAGQAGDGVFVIGTPAYSSTSVFGGAGFDSFFVETDQPACLGPVYVYGDPTVGEYSYYYDYVNAAPQAYTVSNTANPGGPDIEVVQRSGAAPVTFIGIQQVIFYTAHVGGNTVAVHALPQRMFLNMVNGSGDVVVLGRPVPGQGRTLEDIPGVVFVSAVGPISVTLDDSADSVGRNVVLHPKTSTNPDYITGLPGQFNMVLDDSASVSILGGLGDDSFQIDSTAFDAAIRIDGGLGSNTLDYSGAPEGVYVNLATHAATGLRGGIDRIRNVIGSAYNDILVNGSNPNGIITGGAGRDILIAGDVAATLYGGDGEDLLIGGTTNYDKNAAALSAIKAEWSRTDIDYDTRVADLVNGSGVPALNATTVHRNGGANQMSGGLGRDLFFAQLVSESLDRNDQLETWIPV